MPYCWPEINRLPEVSPGKKGLFRISRELQQRLCNHRKPRLGLFRTRKGELFYKRDKEDLRAVVNKQSWHFIGWVLAWKDKNSSFLLLGSATVTGHQSSPFWSPECIGPKGPIFWLLMQRADSLEMTISNGKDWRQEETTGWDGWMVSPSQWTWVRATSGRWWRIGRPGVPQSMGLQRTENNWVTEQQQLVATCSLMTELSPKEHQQKWHLPLPSLTYETLHWVPVFWFSSHKLK